MFSLEPAALFLSLVAVAGWVNVRTVRLPHGVAMLFAGLAGAAGVRVLAAVWPQGAAGFIASVGRMNFSHAVLGYLLAFLLFAGAMQVDLDELRRRRLSVWTLATVGVAASTVIVGAGLWLAGGALGLRLPLRWALVFGALISPTDPVAVLATVKGGALSKGLRAVLQGEALFNDGVGIVVFTALLGFALGGAPDPWADLLKVAVQAAGGLALGVAGGFVVVRAMRAIDDFAVEVTLTLALAASVYAGAQALHLSGPIAAVAAGLLVGARENAGAMSPTTNLYLHSFWTLVDEILNALLFLLLGLQLVLLRIDPPLLGLCAAAALLTALSRFVVVLPWGAYLRRRHKEPGASLLLAWGGLHGALSLALALSLPDGPYRTPILAAAFITATLSVAVQGLTFGPLARCVEAKASDARDSLIGS